MRSHNRAVHQTIRTLSFLFVFATLQGSSASQSDESIGGNAPPRAARSIHLGWAAPECDVFYNEMIVRKSTAGSYFMACGWSSGYFGIQELGGGRKIALFSLWDSGAGDATKSTNLEDRVEVLYKGEGTQVQRFGGEGTGQQCKFDWPWKIGETNRFVVKSFTQGGKTAFAGYIFDSARNRWVHLATFRRRGTEGLKGLYSFVEDFRRDGRSAAEVREAEFQNVCIENKSGGWQTLNRARFTASNAPTEARDSVNAGLTAHGWFLATGGETRRQAEINSSLARHDSQGAGPSDLPGSNP